MRTSAFIACLAAVAACSGYDTTETDLACPAAGVALCSMTSSQRNAVEFMTQDSRDRLAVALTHAPSRSALMVDLGALAGAITAQRITAARAGLERANADLAAARVANVAADTPDLGAIELALFHVSQAIR